jgi:hypothetical protein
VEEFREELGAMLLQMGEVARGDGLSGGIRERSTQQLGSGGLIQLTQIIRTTPVHPEPGYRCGHFRQDLGVEPRSPLIQRTEDFLKKLLFGTDVSRPDDGSV